MTTTGQEMRQKRFDLPSRSAGFDDPRLGLTANPFEQSQNNYDMRPKFWVLPERPIQEQTRSTTRLPGPIQFMKRLLSVWKLTTREAIILLGFDEFDEKETKYARDILNGRSELKGRDIRDRVACLFRIRKTLSALFQDENVENAWLREKRGDLNGQRPMDLLLDGSMTNMLLVADYVDVVAGL